MPNPAPRQTEEFVAKQFKAVSALPDEPLAKAPLAVKVGESIDQAVRALPQKERIEWLRRVISEAAQRELLGETKNPSL